MTRYLWIILGMVVVCFAVGLSGPFLWDDEVMVVANPFIQSVSSIGKVFTSSAFGEPYSPDRFYRPVQILSYVLDVSVWGLKPFGFHLSSLVYHLVTVVGVWFLLGALGLSGVYVVLGTLFFGIHPLHIESVTYISGRGDVLYLMFAVWSFWGFIQGARGRVWGFGLASLAYLVAVFTKENVLPLPLIILVWIVCFCPFSNEDGDSSRLKRWAWMVWGVMASVMVGYLSVRLLGSTGESGTLSWISKATVMERFLTLPYMALTYLRLMLVPFPLHMEYHAVVRSVLDPWFWGALVGSLGFFGVMYRYSMDRRYFWLGSAWLVLGLGTVSQVLIPLASTVREHWATLSLIGWMLIVFSVFKGRLFRLGGDRAGVVVCGVLALYVTVLGWITVDRVLDWTDPLRLYQHDVVLEPRSFVLHNNVGVALFREDRIKEAALAFEKSIEASPGGAYGTAYNNLGVAYERFGSLDAAESLYAKSIEMSHYELAYLNLAKIYLTSERYSEALELLREGVGRHPNHSELKLLLMRLEVFLKSR